MTRVKKFERAGRAARRSIGDEEIPEVHTSGNGNVSDGAAVPSLSDLRQSVGFGFASVPMTVKGVIEDFAGMLLRPTGSPQNMIDLGRNGKGKKSSSPPRGSNSQPSDCSCTLHRRKAVRV